MSIQVSAESKPIGAAVLWEVNPDFTREPVTIASGSGALKARQVLGKITASGKYVPSDPTAADGSQVAVAVLAEDADASSADVVAMAITDGPALIDPAYLIHDAAVDNNTKKQTQINELAAVNIKAVKGA